MVVPEWKSLQNVSTISICFSMVSSKVARANWQHGAEACQRGLHEAGMRDVGRTVDIWRNGSKEWMVDGEWLVNGWLMVG